MKKTSEDGSLSFEQSSYLLRGWPRPLCMLLDCNAFARPGSTMRKTPPPLRTARQPPVVANTVRHLPIVDKKPSVCGLRSHRSHSKIKPVPTFQDLPFDFQASALCCSSLLAQELEELKAKRQLLPSSESIPFSFYFSPLFVFLAGKIGRMPVR